MNDTSPRWRSGDAPKDGSDIVILLGPYELLAYWDGELQTYVLSQPLNIEAVRSPDHWRRSRNSAKAESTMLPDKAFDIAIRLDMAIDSLEMALRFTKDAKGAPNVEILMALDHARLAKRRCNDVLNPGGMDEGQNPDAR